MFYPSFPLCPCQPPLFARQAVSGAGCYDPPHHSIAALTTGSGSAVLREGTDCQDHQVPASGPAALSSCYLASQLLCFVLILLAFFFFFF